MPLLTPPDPYPAFNLRSTRIPIPIAHPNETLHLRRGDVVQVWGHLLEWDEDCATPPELEGYRNTGDPLCDAALRSLRSSPPGTKSTDLLAQLLAAVPTHRACAAFHASLDSPPPESILPPSRAQIARAQAFFHAHSAPILTSLLHFSLAGGFAAPRITRVLHLTSYLVPPAAPTKASADRTFARLLETTQLVVDCMYTPDALEPGTGQGWKSAVRVRMLHGVMRERVRGNEKYDEGADGVPINQEDLAATLASFSAAPLLCLEKMGFTVSEEDAEAFIALWRLIGFYLGIEPPILAKYFRSRRASQQFLGSTMLHLLTFSPSFSSSTNPSAPTPEPLGVPLTLPILHAISNRPPYNTKLESHHSLSHYLLGPSLARALGIPAPTLRARLRTALSLLLMRLPCAFGAHYPRRDWETERRELMREGVMRTVRWQLGMRRTKFRPGGEAEEDEKIRKDEDGARRLRERWRNNIVEMIGVLAVLGIAAVGMAVGAGRMLYEGR